MIELLPTNGLKLVLFRPELLGVFTRPVAGGYAPLGPGEILAASGADAAINGPMFGQCEQPGLHHNNSDYAISICSRLDYLHKDAAFSAPGRYPDRGVTLSVLPDGHAVFLDNANVAPGARVAVQFYPPLVVDGRNVATPTLNTGSEWRSGVALMQDGRLAFAVGTMPMHAFAAALIRAGAVGAAYTDGGGSSALVTAAATAGSSEHRRVASWLIVRKPARNIVVPVLLGLAGAALMGKAILTATRMNPGREPTTLQSLLAFFGSGPFAGPVPLSWAVEKREEFENAWKHSSDPATMISLVSYVVPPQRLAVLLIAMVKMTLPYAGKHSAGISRAMKALDRWVREGTKIDQYKAPAVVDSTGAALDIGETAGTSAAFWATILAGAQPRGRYFPARMVVRKTEDALTAAGQQSQRAVDGQLARMIRDAFPTIKLSDFVLASRQ